MNRNQPATPTRQKHQTRDAFINIQGSRVVYNSGQEKHFFKRNDFKKLFFFLFLFEVKLL